MHFNIYQIGIIPAPPQIGRFGTVEGGAFGVLLQLIFNVMIVAGGIYAVFNFILAGYSFLSAGDDPQKASNAWKKIYQSLIGLIFIAGAFVLAGVVGQIIFGDATALLQPSIPTL